MTLIFRIRLRMIGWLLLAAWYSLYGINLITPLFVHPIVFLLHGISGLVMMALLLLGYARHKDEP